MFLLDKISKSAKQRSPIVIEVSFLLSFQSVTDDGRQDMFQIQCLTVALKSKCRTCSILASDNGQALDIPVSYFHESF